MELSNEKTRCELDEYLKNYGVKHTYIAELTGLSDTTICLFLQGQRCLSLPKLEVIYKVIHDRIIYI